MFCVTLLGFCSSSARWHLTHGVSCRARLLTWFDNFERTTKSLWSMLEACATMNIIQEEEEERGEGGGGTRRGGHPPPLPVPPPPSPLSSSS